MIDQIMIGVTGTLAVYFSQTSNVKLKRWACILGLIGQPFWFYTTYTAEQWGIFILAFIYTAGWLVGVRTYWFKEVTE